METEAVAHVWLHISATYIFPKKDKIKPEYKTKMSREMLPISFWKPRDALANNRMRWCILPIYLSVSVFTNVRMRFTVRTTVTFLSQKQQLDSNDKRGV